ncbi:energy transducer TonB, partial [Staphylococcus aureus]|uniref:energy transducer TonB family protein n=1 Tax=Staphylococcus aureus TaxID=1280 RepID=UPI0011D26C8B
FVVVVRFNLDTSGKLDGRPSVEKSSVNRQFDESAVRAVQKCDVAGLQVPAGKQDIWNDIRVTFDPREMLGL